jgi:hypothetical protein
MSEATVGAIVGIQQCGKTTAAKAKSRLEWRRHKRRSLVLDPWRSDWGPWAWVTDDKAAFLRAAFGVHGFAVFWDESSDSLDRNASEDKAFFTRLRARDVGGKRIGHPAIYVMAHDFKALAPIMRGNLNEVLLFRQNEDRANDWARHFADRALLQSAELQKYEFIIKRPFETARRVRPKSPADLDRYL